MLEVNAEHPVIQALEALRAKNADDPRLEAMCQLLYDQAVIGEGAKVQDPAAFAKRLERDAGPHHGPVNLALIVNPSKV